MCFFVADITAMWRTSHFSVDVAALSNFRDGGANLRISHWEVVVSGHGRIVVLARHGDLFTVGGMNTERETGKRVKPCACVHSFVFH